MIARLLMATAALLHVTAFAGCIDTFARKAGATEAIPVFAAEGARFMARLMTDEEVDRVNKNISSLVEQDTRGRTRARIAAAQFCIANHRALAKIKLYGAAVTHVSELGPEIVFQVPDESSLCALIAQAGVARIWPDPMTHVEAWHMGVPPGDDPVR